MNTSVLGIISDTHGLLRPEALDALRGCDRSLQAGDIGFLSILDELRKIAPVFAVRGNNDYQPWARELPLRETIEVADSLIYMLHDLHDLDLHEYWKDDVLYLNPGSAGPRRFDLPVTVARMDLSQRPWVPEFITLLKTR